MKPRSPARDPRRNVWLQLGVPDAETHYLKAELVLRLSRSLRTLGLTQREAARRLSTTQPELSKILSGKFSEVSLERLLRFLARLGHSVEIRVGDSVGRNGGAIAVKDARRRVA
jgi:predicted XRE-type DNA-binding protein